MPIQVCILFDSTCFEINLRENSSHGSNSIHRTFPGGKIKTFLRNQPPQAPRQDMSAFRTIYGLGLHQLLYSIGCSSFHRRFNGQTWSNLRVGNRNRVVTSTYSCRTSRTGSGIPMQKCSTR